MKRPTAVTKVADKSETLSTGLKVGESLYVITGSGIHAVGKLQNISNGLFLVLTNCSFLKDHLTYQAIVDGRLATVEPVGDVCFGLGHIQAIMPWAHTLPRLPWGPRR